MIHKSAVQVKRDFDDVVMSYIAKRIFSNSVNEPSFYNGEDAPLPTTTLTNLDRFVSAIGHRVGNDSLCKLLDVYSGYSDVDDLLIVKSLDRPITNNHVKGFNRIISKVESLGYLDEVRDAADYVSTDGDVDNKMSWALTILTFLLYSLRLNRMVTSVEFDANALTSVETTFYVTGYPEYNVIREFCVSNALIVDGKVSSKGIRALVSCAVDMVDYDLLTNVGNRIEDQSRNWRHLSERR